MQIIQNTPDRLVVVEHPWFFAAILALFTAAIVNGLVTSWLEMELAERTLLVGLVIMFPLGAHYFVHWVRVEFDRITGRIDITRRGLFHHQHRTYSLRYLNHVRVEEHNDEGVTYRAVLVFDEAMLAEMEPARRARLEKRKSQGLRQAAANEAPLTAYYSSTSNVKAAVMAVNQWLGAPA